MTAPKIKLGRIPCDCCGHSVLLKQNEAGTLTVQCDECDISAFAKKGTACAARWRAKLPAAPAAPVENAPGSVPKATAPTPAAPPAGTPPKDDPKPKASPFDPLAFLNKSKAAA